MKVPAPIPKSIRIIERESFLSSVEKRGHLLLRARLENPGNHLLVIFTDPDERYAILGETGPECEYADVREASRRAPAGFAVRYVVPCAQCPPYAIPRDLATTTLPLSLAPLESPPGDFKPAAREDFEGVKEDPNESSGPSFKLVSSASRPAGGGPLRMPRVQGVPVPEGPASEAAPAEAPAFGGALSRGLQDLEKSLAERDADLRRRETELAVKTTSLSKERRLFEEESARVNREAETRENELFRREGELQSRAEALLRSLRELDELRRKIEALAGRPGGL